MAKKIRAGLYRLKYDLGEIGYIEYDIERIDLGGDLAHWGSVGEWVVTYTLFLASGMMDNDCFERAYVSKRETIEAIEYVQEHGRWVYVSGLGWCLKGV